MRTITPWGSASRVARARPGLRHVFLLLLLSLPAFASTDQAPGVPILLYHRFGPVAADSMTVTTAVFASHLKYLHEHGYRVIPLADLIAHLQGRAPPPPPCSVVIVADDGHRSIYSDMLPLVRQHRIPVTLFIYPSAISNASYAMTWEQLRELKQTGLFEMQAHTYWHPNFKIEKRRRSPDDYARFVDTQLIKAKEKLEQRLGGTMNMLAWPFGIYDDELIRHAAKAGYVAAFTLDRRHVSASDRMLALPRYLISDANRGKAFEQLFATTTTCQVTP